MKLLHLAKTQPPEDLLPPALRTSLADFGELTVVEDASLLPEAEIIAKIRNCDVLVTGWGNIRIPDIVAVSPGSLRYICHITGEMRGIVPLAIIRAGIPVTNWGDVPAFEIAEGAFTLLLACLKNLRSHIEEKQQGEWRLIRSETSGSLRGLRLGLYGYGAIGRAFAELCRPFSPEIRVFDPYATNIPSDFIRVEALDTLFAQSDAVAIHTALTPETKHTVGVDQLALLPAGGIVINTARGSVVDQEALFTELASGRLRAGLDVLDGDDRLPPDHPARHWPNVIFTAHDIHSSDWRRDPDGLRDYHLAALENLRRFAHGEPLRFTMDETRYNRST